MTPAAALDDRDFDDLVREGIALLAVYAPQWTDHNPSDPGITLIELLAYFSDGLLYRIGRITPAAKLQFLRLLKGSPDYDLMLPPETGTEPTPGIVDPSVELKRAIDEAVSELAHMDCAVTPADFERFALACAQRTLPDCPVRVLCLSNADLSAGRSRTAEVDARGHVSVVLALPASVPPHEAAHVRDAVRQDLASRCLLTTRVHVIAPVELHVGIGFEIALAPGVSRQTALAGIGYALQRRFGEHASLGEAAVSGQMLNLASIAMTIDSVDGIDYVQRVAAHYLTTEPDAPDRGLGVQIGVASTVGVTTRIGGHRLPGTERLVRDSEGLLASIVLEPWEQLRLVIVNDRVTIINPPGRAPRRHPGGGHG
jgi:hypothetical protein